MVSWACLLVLMPLMATTGSSFPSSSRRQAYIVHMDAAMVAALDLSLAGTKRWYDAAIDSLVELSSEEADVEDDDDAERLAPRLLYVYETVISGFAAVLSPKQARFLPQLHGFLSASPDEVLLRLHTTYSPQFLGLVPGKGLWGANSSTSASDVVVGVIDTGVWPEHVSFSDERLSGLPIHWKGACEVGQQFSGLNCNKKLVGARAFYGGYEANIGKIDKKSEYRSARDSNGHGTHTASTAAGDVVAGASLFGNARGSASGISYASRVAVYKACWSSGCATSDILKAVDHAVADGVDVLSLSLGGGSLPFYSDTLAIGAFGAVQKGVFVACSAGNSGPSESSVSNTAPWITTVAASYLDRSFPTTVTLGDGRTFRGASLYVGRPTKRAQLVFDEKAGGGGATYCLPRTLVPRLVRGKIVLCNRGLSGRLAKGEEVKRAGGSGMLLLNTEDQGEELFADPHVLPASSVGAVAAMAITNYTMSSSRPTAAITFDRTTYGFPAPAIAAFSSRGPNAVSPDIIKPDIAAPGVSILAAWPPTVSPSLLKSDRRRVAFNIISGTSMSCPHVSGVAALVKSRHPDWSPAALKSAMMTTAYTLDNRGKPIGDVSKASPATPFALGSGHVNPERAADPGLVYDITTGDYLNYLCSIGYTPTQIKMLAKRSYSCPKNRRALQAGDLNYPSFAVLFLSGGAANATATFTRTATNVGPAGCRYTVNVREPEGVSVTVDPRVLGFLRKGQKLSYRVTFVGRGGIGSSFGEVVWVCGSYSVRSPIAATWV